MVKDTKGYIETKARYGSKRKHEERSRFRNLGAIIEI
ncbi:MAG: hypothetical protein CM15mV10_1520 [uncultured marine virus]|nr:MAG: hypothetical protein CM15mV10_1520 [uncultured marine virus]